MNARLIRSTRVPSTPEELFAWHERPGAFQRLTPPWESTSIEQADGSLEVGATVVLRTRVAPGIAPRWVAEHVEYDPPNRFRDVQRRGPFASWDHTHLFVPDGPDASTLTDDVTYRLPFGRLGDIVAGRFVRARLERMFAYRHRITAADLAAHARTRGAPPMKVAITGASGLIGSELAPFLTTGGHDVIRMVRGTSAGPGEAAWDPSSGTIDTSALRGVDAVIHLAGEGIGEKRWTDEQKRRIRDSRTVGTGLVARTLAGMDDGPRVLVVASAIGYYGDRGDEVLTEESSPGTGFAAELVQAWEQAADPAREAGIRVAHVRTGIVQTPKGGALGKQLPLAKVGLGAPFGNGRQILPWVTIDDVIGIYHHALVTDSVTGPINAVAPNPVTNTTYARTLGKVLRRPTLPIGIPKFAPSLLLGRELVEELLFSSMNIRPAVAESTGYAFRHPDLETGLRAVLGR